MEMNGHIRIPNGTSIIVCSSPEQYRVLNIISGSILNDKSLSSDESRSWDETYKYSIIEYDISNKRLIITFNKFTFSVMYPQSGTVDT